MTREILKVVVGSKMWGTDTPVSDTDLKIVVMDPLATILDPFEHGTKSEQGKEGQNDVTRYELRHFTRLACKGNPSILEVLFSTEVYDSDVIGDELRRIRGAFLDSRAIWRAHNGFINGQREEARRRMGYDRHKKGRPIGKLLSSSIIAALQGYELLTHGGFNPSTLLKDNGYFRTVEYVEFHRELKVLDDRDPRLQEWFPEIEAALTQLVEEMNRAYTDGPTFDADLETIREFTYAAYMRATRT